MSLPAPEVVDALRTALDANAVLVGDDALAHLVDPRNQPTATEAVFELERGQQPLSISVSLGDGAIE